MLTTMRLAPLALLLAVTTAARAQFEIQNSHTTASLRGIHSVDGQVAWASGTEGTVLRTADAGTDWQRCPTPPDADKLDFRGIQAFDRNTAIVMSSGKGNLSRLYKTTDGCKSWKLLFTNPDKEGFWDAIQFVTPKVAWILGDPIPSSHPNRKAQFVIYLTENGGVSFKRQGYPTLEADPSTSGAFAASNSSLLISPSQNLHGWCWFGAGGIAGPRIFHGGYYSDVTERDGFSPIAEIRWEQAVVPLATGAASGVFSIALQGSEKNDERDWIFHAHLVAVGGNYLKPDETLGNASFTMDGGQHWNPAQTSPHGYRSSVAYDTNTKTWITVGPNGTDISRDNGRNWNALKPDPQDQPDDDKNWNALSLPFVAGPKGRIGKLHPNTLKH
jgi:photosystem II stability/assembly factor-like uncharacterized protein